MRACETFVFLDDVQMPNRQSYMTRSQMRKAEGAVWLTVPMQWMSYDVILETNAQFRELQTAEAKWPADHLRKLFNWYRKAPHFREVIALLEQIYAHPGTLLAEFNMAAIRSIAGYLGLERRFEISSQLQPEGTSDDRLISLMQKLGGTMYISGKGGTNYQDPEKFAAAGIELQVREYKPVAYPQFNGEFIGGLSIVDALFNCGRDTVNLLSYD